MATSTYGNAQPLNTTIQVFRRARVFRDNRRFASIKDLTTPFQTPLVSVPGQENLVLETRDNFVSDAFQYGHAVVVYPRQILTLAQAVSQTPGGVVVSKLPGNEREIQVEMTSANLRTDLYNELQQEQTALPGGSTNGTLVAGTGQTTGGTIAAYKNNQ